jgi:tetratricopeptide (TPR) repeat protein/serine phosphatase RsbU (regulator of sigma subunit)
MACYRDNKNDMAIEYFEKSLPGFEKTNDNYKLASVYMYLGNIYYGTKENDKAKERYNQALKLYLDLNETYYAADILYNLGNIQYFREKEYKAAKKSFDDAARYYEANNEEEYAAYSLFYIGEIGFYQTGEYSTAIPAYEKALNYYRLKKDDKKVASILKNLGDMYDETHQYDKSLTALNEAATLYEKDGNYTKLGDTYIVKANIVYFRGDYVNALTAYQNSLTAYEKGKSLDGMGGSYVGLGNLYHSKDQDVKALEMYEKSLQCYEKAGGTHYTGISSAMTGIGNIYYSSGDYDKALDYYLKGIEVDDKANNSDGKVIKLMNIGNIYMNRGDYDKTLEYLNKSMEENEKTGDKQKKASILNLMGFLNNRQKAYDEAIKNCGASLEISQELGLLPQSMENYSCLYSAYYNKGQFKEALDYYYGYISSRDSITNEKRSRELNKRQLEYEYGIKEATLKADQEKQQMALQEEIKRKQMMFTFERKQAAMKAETEKKQLAMAEQMKRKELAMDFEKKEQKTKMEKEQQALLFKKDIEKKRIQNEAQKKITYWLIAGMSLMCILAFFIYRGYREKRKANKVILEQKREVELQKEEITQKSWLLEEKNKEILDSINYAKRLQDAILPPMKLVKEHLKESFVLYKPKDIVAGDFYWMEYRGDTLYFAAADCTGHGVPGAMVSVVCSNAMDRAVKEFGITEPGKILDKVRELVIETFQKSESEVKDGMDISLCSVHVNARRSHETGIKMKWSGANNPLWILRNGATDMEEIRADKQPIGIFAGAVPFTTHEVQLHPGDSIYIFTDGYADQFGGEKGKKFKASNMKKLIMENRQLPMDEQFTVMNDYFESWRGSLEQIDDVCMIGVRF